MNPSKNSTDGFWHLGHVSDADLLAGLSSLLQSSRSAMARLIAHLAEVEERRLHLAAACPSMFAYCTERLRMSEDEACRRIDAARLARKYPFAFSLLDAGELSLTVLCLLKEHLTEENYRELLKGVSRKSVRHAREWLATRFPQPDVPSTIRQLAARGISPSALVPAPARAPSAPVLELPASHTWPGASREFRASKGRVDPLSEARFRVQFTASRKLKDKLELVRDLMGHACPGADLPVIIERAVDLLAEDLMRSRFGNTPHPQRRQRQARSDRVVVATRRTVVERDGLGCSYVDAEGKRCGSRAFLQLDHVHPRARGGGSEPENVRQLCAAHNRWLAEREFGRKHVERAVARRRGTPTEGGAGSEPRIPMPRSNGDPRQRG